MDNRIGKMVGLGVLAAVVLMLGYGTDWFGFATPRFAEGKVYDFSYTYKGTAPIGAEGDQIGVETRSFVVDQSTTFVALARGPRGEVATYQASAISPNTFTWVWVMVPEVRIGGEIFQESYRYREVRYNLVQEEPQKVVPNLKPKH